MEKLSGKFNSMEINSTLKSDLSEILIIGLDFGTTYSGVSYCFANQNDPKPTTIEDWPGI